MVVGRLWMAFSFDLFLFSEDLVLGRASVVVVVVVVRLSGLRSLRKVSSLLHEW
jgi:hypothetical protein